MCYLSVSATKDSPLLVDVTPHCVNGSCVLQKCASYHNPHTINGESITEITHKLNVSIVIYKSMTNFKEGKSIHSNIH